MSDEKTTSAPPKRGDAPRDWPNTIAAAARTGLTRQQLNKLAERGALKVEKDSGGVWRWDPDMLELVAAAREGDDVDDDTEEGTAVKVRSTGLAEAVALLRQAHQHQEQTLQLVRDPASKLLDRYAADNEVLRARVAHLEKRQDELIEARERYLSEQHVRDLLTQDQQRSSDRKDKALAMVKDLAPKLLSAVSPEAQTVVKLLQSLSEEQRAMLLLTDLLTPEQKEQVRAVLRISAPAEAPAGETAQAAE